MKKLLFLCTVLAAATLHAGGYWPNTTANSKGLKILFVNNTRQEYVIKAHYQGTNDCHREEQIISPAYDDFTPGEIMFETGTDCCLIGYDIIYAPLNAKPKKVHSATKLNRGKGICADLTFIIGTDKRGALKVEF